MSGPYEIRYAEEAGEDIRGLRAFDQSKVMDGIEEYLTVQPSQESKSRIKAMSQPFWSQYRLRVDDFRVYYRRRRRGACRQHPAGAEKGQ